MKQESLSFRKERFNQELKKHPISIETGQFGAEMAIHLINDGPVTFILEH
ncbi:MAG: D-aminoacyl-tRNA deacylase [Chlamydiales bacterium]|nr:D-aminoacyl-tRNA deacylase [Chlamydiales bacterium]